MSDRQVWRDRRLATLYAVVALSVAGTGTYTIAKGVSTRLIVRTSIVGFPIHRAFNVDRYFKLFDLAVFLFPLASLGIFLFLKRIRSFDWGIFGFDSRPSDVPIVESRRGSGLLRAAFIGGVLGSEVCIAANLSSGATVVVVSMSSLFLASLWLLVTTALSRLTSRLDLGAALNFAGGLLVVPGLWFVSKVTQVHILNSNSTRLYPWLPLVAAIGLPAVIALANIKTFARGEPGSVERLEERVALWLVAPIALFLALALIPGALGRLDAYHEGESLVAAKFVSTGGLPWKGIYFIHGLLQDVLAPLFGMKLFENSRWGATAGETLVLFPVYWLAHYLLYARLFRRSILFLVFTQLILLLGLFNSMDFRFVLWPLILLSFLCLLDKASLPRAATFTLLCGFIAVITPESAFAVLAIGLTLILHDWIHRKDGSRFRRTWLCGAVAAAFIVFLVVTLAQGDLLQDFINFYKTFGPGHRLTGGVPIDWAGLGYLKLAVYVALPLAIVIAGFWLTTCKLMSGTDLSQAGWMAVGLGLALVLNFGKFLARPDLGHLGQIAAFASPLLLYALYSVVRLSDRLLERLLPRGFNRISTASALLIAFLILAYPLQLTGIIKSLPQRFRASVENPSWLPALGFANADALDPGLFRGIEDVVERRGRGKRSVFDFTNEPAIFYFLLDKQAPTRYYHVSLAIRPETQRDLLDEMAQSNPSLVIFDEQVLGQPAWDGIQNMVRHYEISDFILQNYKPVEGINSYIFMVPKGGSGSSEVSDRELYFRSATCDWGYAPNFLYDPDFKESRVVDIPVAQDEGGLFRIDLPVGNPADFRWLEIESGESLGDDSFLLSDSETFAKSGISFKTMGTRKRVRVRVGSCIQWYGFSGDKIYGRHSGNSTIKSVRLLG